MMPLQTSMGISFQNFSEPTKCRFAIGNSAKIGRFLYCFGSMSWAEPWEAELMKDTIIGNVSSALEAVNKAIFIS